MILIIQRLPNTGANSSTRPYHPRRASHYTNPAEPGHSAPPGHWKSAASDEKPQGKYSSSTCLHGLLVFVVTMLVALLLTLGDKDHNLVAIYYSVAEMTNQLVLNVG